MPVLRRPVEPARVDRKRLAEAQVSFDPFRKGCRQRARRYTNPLYRSGHVMRYRAASLEVGVGHVATRLSWCSRWRRGDEPRSSRLATTALHNPRHAWW